jgi:hypothetical protein
LNCAANYFSQVKFFVFNSELAFDMIGHMNGFKVHIIKYQEDGIDKELCQEEISAICIPLVVNDVLDYLQLEKFNIFNFTAVH